MEGDEAQLRGELAKKIMETAGFTYEGLLREIEKKKAEYDMLTDEGALVLIANELGITPEERETPPSTRIADLKPGMQGIDVVGRVVGIDPPREFVRKDGSKGYVAGILLADRTGSVRLTLWDQECRVTEEVEVGDIVRVVGGLCRSGVRGCEIYTARRARLLLNPTSVEDPRVAELQEVSEIPDSPPARRRISDLEEGDVDIEVRATVVKAYRVWTYDACPRCGRKVVGGSCSVCGPVEPVPRIIVDIGIDDCSGFMRAKLFGEDAESLMGVSASMVRREVDRLTQRGMDPRRASEEFLARAGQAFLGREVVLRGRVTMDEYRGLVLSVADIRQPDPVAEARTILEEVEAELG